MMADYEDLQESEVSEVHIKRFRSQEVFVKGAYEFPSANGTLDVLIVQDPSLQAEGNLELEDDVEIEEGHKKGR